MSRPSLARRERHSLCDLALVLGADVPTLCGDWTARDLVAHLLVRENRPLGALGVIVPQLSGLTDREMAKVSRPAFNVMVEKLRNPGLTPFRLPGVEQLANTIEYFVHHEDLRRAQPGWEPRDLAPADADTLWSLLRRMGMMLGRSAGVPLRIVRSDGTGQSATLRHGSDPVTITGPVCELVLFLHGRSQVRDLTFDGPDDAVAKVREASYGI